MLKTLPHGEGDDAAFLNRKRGWAQTQNHIPKPLSTLLQKMKREVPNLVLSKPSQSKLREYPSLNKKIDVVAKIFRRSVRGKDGKEVPEDSMKNREMKSNSKIKKQYGKGASSVAGSHGSTGGNRSTVAGSRRSVSAQRYSGDHRGSAGFNGGSPTRRRSSGVGNAANRGSNASGNRSNAAGHRVSAAGQGVNSAGRRSTATGHGRISAAHNRSSSTGGVSLSNRRGSAQSDSSILNESGTLIREGTTVFVGNVPTNTKRQQLIKLFSPYGKVLSVRFRTPNGKIIWQNRMRQDLSSVNAYVVFDNKKSALQSLELNGTFLRDHILRVQTAERFSGPNNLCDDINPKNLILVGNLRSTANDNKLYQIFSNCGEIDYVRTLQSAERPGCNGTAFVCFKNPYAAALAMDLKGTVLDDRPMNIERYIQNRFGGSNCKELQSKRRPIRKFTGTPFKSPCTDVKNKKQGKISNTKKSDYRGCKADIKKKKCQKQANKELKKLAKKIAPRC